MRRRALHAHGVTLVEVIALMTVIAIAVPPLAALSVSGARAVTEERRAYRVAWLATAVLEQIEADAATDDEAVDLSAMGEPAYTADLRGRLARLTEEYEAAGLTYEVLIDAARAADGSFIDAEDRAATRLVTVTVRYTSELGRAVEAPFSSVVGRP